MSLGSLLLALWFILYGITGLGWVSLGTKFLFVWALVTGIVLLVEQYHPVVVPIGRRHAA